MDKKHRNIDKKIISFIPDGEFYYQKGIKAMQRERYDDAHKYLQRAVELSPSDPLILMQYGILIMEEGMFEEAYEILAAAHGIDPEEEDIIFYLAEVHAHLGLLRDAKVYAEKYIALSPDGPLVDDSMEIIDFAEQEEDIFDDEEMPDGEVYFLQEKARRLMEGGLFDEAIEILEAIIVDYPEFWAAYNNLALAYFYVGKIDQAKELLYDVLDKNKGNIHALCNLAVFYYYQKDKEELDALLDLLLKIKPYQFIHRYKLGATFALVGKHKEAYGWLRSLKKRGFEGDAGYYFWLAHSAYFSGNETAAKEAYEKLVELDPSKAGLEPWKSVQETSRADSFEQDREFLLSKIMNKYRSERLLGFYLLGKSAHKQEIISHPKYIDLEKLSSIEQLFLAHSLDYEFTLETDFDHSFMRALETTDIIYKNYKPLDKQGTHLFQMWFTLCEVALTRSYDFRNPDALAAAADYMFQSSRYKGVTKTAIAKSYGISVPTLTKYVHTLMEFLPQFSE
ncbi:tetratricopeptide repeat protein [Sporosarcina thermotolerans]|uniref:Tetratricopeptide repeat protein n=1 Tax=Sporosarcina thermotolerans TaxID=633404 RepID=A0AAW9AH65_9BACL|nr:tetratricopeptide repeat protein [Sporosarcina thermotolerans]MDW0118406.1 tetratricopeptide repeat protein [Sporosarcina thermotolerans]WHT49455.1 tetratricopeptide repeat protein [Sporosarcina thermotolerans]